MDILTALDPNTFSFECKGYASIRVTNIDQQGRQHSRVVSIPIKSINQDEAQKFVETIVTRPRAPRRRVSENGKFITVEDLADEKFIEALNAYNIIVAESWVLHALDIDIKSKSGEVVWSADNKIRNYIEAKYVLDSMGLVQMQFIEIIRQVRKLAEMEEEEELQD